MIENLDEIRLPDRVYPVIQNETNIAGIKDEWFISGPIPGQWISQASNLSGNYTLHVALAIQYVNGLTKKSNKIVVERFHLARFGVKKDSARRALKRLQEAGLIEYTKTGQKFKVTILSTKPESAAKTAQ